MSEDLVVEPGDRVRVITGAFKGRTGVLEAIEDNMGIVDFDGSNGKATIGLGALELEVWLTLTCCNVGRSIAVDWIGTTFGDLTVDFVLCRPRSIFGSKQEVVHVRFCPGCGTKAPKLVRRAEPTSFHDGAYDENGTCRICRVRYCSGSSPSRCYRPSS